jgi:cupin 2 domain-containing protein
MAERAGNLFSNMRGPGTGEQIDVLLKSADVRIERIVSHGEASAPGFWYDQDWAEWVMVVAGSAGLLIEGEAAPRALTAGDYVHLPAHCRHRVEWTDPDRPTIWLAVHLRTDI